MSDQTEHEIEAAIAEYGLGSTWNDLSDRAKRLVRLMDGTEAPRNRRERAMAPKAPATEHE